MATHKVELNIREAVWQVEFESTCCNVIVISELMEERKKEDFNTPYDRWGWSWSQALASQHAGDLLINRGGGRFSASHGYLAVTAL